MKFDIFGLTATVDIRPLPGAWVAELLGVHSRGPVPIKDEISMGNIYMCDTKG